MAGGSESGRTLGGILQNASAEFAWQRWRSPDLDPPDYMGFSV